MRVGFGQLLYRAASGFTGTAILGCLVIGLYEYLETSLQIVLVLWAAVALWLIWRALIIAVADR